MKPRILIYDKDQAITRQLFWTLCEDYDVVTANDLQYVKTLFPKSRILGMTSEVFPKTKKKYLSLGVDELLDKPFDTEQLLDSLRRLAPLRSLDGIESGSFTACY